MSGSARAYVVSYPRECVLDAGQVLVSNLFLLLNLPIQHLRCALLKDQIDILEFLPHLSPLEVTRKHWVSPVVMSWVMSGH